MSKMDDDFDDEVDPYINKISDILHNVDTDVANRVLVIMLIDFCINYVVEDRRNEWLDSTISLLREAINDPDLRRDLLKSECEGNA